MQEHTNNGLVSFSYTIFAPYRTMSSIVSTRLGGASLPPYHTLNLALSVGDERETVLANREKLCASVEVSRDFLTVAQLVQGTHIAVVTQDVKDLSPTQRLERFAETDGLLTNVPYMALMVLVADCAAITFYDPQCQVVALAHAGWRGTVGGIVPKMVAKMNEVFGCDPADILVGVSPSIGPCCYEVRADLVAAFHAAFGKQANLFFIQQPQHSIHLDLWMAQRWQLHESGILPEHIEMADICTACHTDLFYSNRAEKGKTGRFGGLAVLRS